MWQEYPEVVLQLEHTDKENTYDLEPIIRHYNQLLFRIGMSYLKSREDAEDAMQNTWLKAFGKINEFKRQSKYSTWLCRIMINECLMILRKYKQKQKMDMKEADGINYTGDDMANQMTREQLKKWFEEALLQLQSDYRAVYVMREVEGLSTDETAEILNISLENVKVRLHRAKKMLQEKLMEKVPASELYEFHLNRCNRFTERVLEKIKEVLCD